MSKNHFSTVLGDYADIQTTSPKWRRKERHQALQSWLAKSYDLPDYNELTRFITWADEQKISLNVIFQRKVVNPVFDSEIFERLNAQAMKIMLLHFSDTDFLAYKGDYSISLLNIALGLLPDDIELLEHHWNKMRYYHDFTIHEIPWCGVLWGMVEGATLENMDALESDLTDFEALTGRLGHDAANLIAACRDSYALWRIYLNNTKQYIDFMDCIRHNRHVLSQAAITYIWGDDAEPFSNQE